MVVDMDPHQQTSIILGSSVLNTKAVAKTSKAVESSQETSPLIDSISESPEVMEIHLDWRTPFMVYRRTGSLPEDKNEQE
jgi:hypothetical protein